MPNTQSAAKRVRQNARNSSRNTSALRAIRTQQKKFFLAIKEGDKDAIHKAFSALSSLFDKATKHGMIHRNLASRKKSLAAGLLHKRTI